MWPDYELWKGALSDVFLFFLILHNEISMSHVIDSSENLLMTGMSYFCTVSPWDSCWPYTGISVIFPSAGTAWLHALFPLSQW